MLRQFRASSQAADAREVLHVVQAALYDITGVRTVPQVFIDGKFVGGSDGVYLFACLLSRSHSSIIILQGWICKCSSLSIIHCLCSCGTGSGAELMLRSTCCCADTLALHSSGKLKSMLDDIGVSAKFD